MRLEGIQRHQVKNGRQEAEKSFFAGILLDRIDHGAVAQLGERLHGMQEVESSNLFGSIINLNFIGIYKIYKFDCFYFNLLNRLL
jgi:hypothetical protein